MFDCSNLKYFNALALYHTKIFILSRSSTLL
nr:MAG TPA: hypothetical protein [Caudoviricetes sp.]